MTDNELIEACLKRLLANSQIVLSQPVEVGGVRYEPAIYGLIYLGPAPPTEEVQVQAALTEALEAVDIEALLPPAPTGKDIYAYQIAQEPVKAGGEFRFSIQFAESMPTTWPKECRGVTRAVTREQLDDHNFMTLIRLRLSKLLDSQNRQAS